MSRCVGNQRTATQQGEDRLMTEDTANRKRLDVLDALLAATRRPHEVLDLVLEAADGPTAASAIATLLGTSPDASRAVIEMQWRRLTRKELERLKTESDDLRRQLIEPTSQG